jgi:predicted acyl esterase
LIKAHPLDDKYHQERSPDWSKVTVPMLSSGNWGGQSLHLRGNIEGFVRAASKPCLAYATNPVLCAISMSTAKRSPMATLSQRRQGPAASPYDRGTAATGRQRLQSRPHRAARSPRVPLAASRSRQPSGPPDKSAGPSPG